MPGILGHHALSHTGPQREFCSGMEKAGFWIARQGKHIVMTDGTRIVTIPRHNPVNAIATSVSLRNDLAIEDNVRNT